MTAPHTGALSRSVAARLVPVTLGSRSFGRLEPYISVGAWRELDAAERGAAELLAGRVIWHVSSTARGGGVAEMLRTLTPYWRGAGLDARWLLLRAPTGFFRLTKRLHELLHGEIATPPGPEDRELYDQVSEQAARDAVAVVGQGDVVVLHDAQTAGLVAPLVGAGAVVVWRCHVGADDPSDPGRSAWRFLLPRVAPAHAYVFTRDAFIPPELRGARAWRITPAIDPCSPKNRQLDRTTSEAILTSCGMLHGPGSTIQVHGVTVGARRRCEVVGDRLGALGTGEPLVVALSRWDRLKDPVGIMRGFAEYVEHPAARLVLAGPAVDAVADDPGGAGVLAETRRAWSQLPDASRARVQLAVLPMDDLDENALIVNALQREASIIVKKSLKEGFGLGVTEGMWKARPVIATRVGGHQDQITHGATGVLLDDPADRAAFGAAVDELLGNQLRAAALGRHARERVRERYLADRHFIGWMPIIAAAIASRSRERTTPAGARC